MTEPAGYELPTHWGHWIDKNDCHWWVFKRNGKLMAQLLDSDTGMPDDECSFSSLCEINSEAMLGGWHPAVVEG